MTRPPAAAAILLAAPLRAEPLRPYEAPVYAAPPEVPPLPAEYLKHDQAGIRFAYHPSARERAREHRRQLRGQARVALLQRHVPSLHHLGHDLGDGAAGEGRLPHEHLVGDAGQGDRRVSALLGVAPCDVRAVVQPIPLLPVLGDRPC